VLRVRPTAFSGASQRSNTGALAGSFSREKP